MPTSATERGWQAIFDELGIPGKLKSDGIAFVTADEIRRFARREPRLMTKFDAREERPKTLRQHDVTVLAVENGRYALVQGDGYHDFHVGSEPQLHTGEQLRSIESLPWKRGLISESQALDSAFIASILLDFTGENSLHLTVRGRLRSGAFAFDFQGNDRVHRLTANGVQIETDGGYEGTRLYLIEAKMGVRENFIVRQLYYPFRMWTDGSQVQKEVVPILMTYSNRVFALRAYRFADAELYNSIELVKAADYILEELEEPSLARVLSETKLGSFPPGVPFPQADVLPKLADLVDAVASGVRVKEDIADRFDYDLRQADYYGNAARFLGLARRATGGFIPTDNTIWFSTAGLTERVVYLGRAMAGLPVFRQTMIATLEGSPLSIHQISDLIRRYTNLSAVTSHRRARSVHSWIQWLESHTV